MKKFFVFFLQNNLTSKEDQDLLDLVEEPKIIPWISDDELNHYAIQFQKSGFTGGLNYYRNMGLNWELMAPWMNTGILVPALYIAGDRDCIHSMGGMKEFIHGGDFAKLVPNLKEIVIIPGGHFIQQENNLQKVKLNLLKDNQDFKKTAS
ncbi:hypothetical protein O6H91_14G028300 [Diphasiastrum complanatum]|uniref:Uncharacterized protein n=1 Tax=Diphasiastrum complanatum TaxID=34168 RepID=A0ACC2BMT8_DIPCM|nr:hypothetical protein O6H91_14G028300 [Diphasiastrum complanatum]